MYPAHQSSRLNRGNRMRILWYSATPECQSGYGNASRSMISWLTRQGHFVVPATKHPTDVRFRKWEVPGTDKTVPIVCGTNMTVLNDDVMDKWEMNVCISMFDVWAMKEPINRLIPWIPIDTQNVSEKIVDKVKDCPMQIAMTQHGKVELETFELEPEYAPIGFDPEIFHPKPDGGAEFRACFPWKDGLKPEEMFLIGSVGLNYGDDRKGFVFLMQAFKSFHDKHPEARLYLHTQGNKENEGMAYGRIAQELGIMDYVAWADPATFWFGEFSAEELASIYSGFDLFCLPTRGEGFGMPIIEAQMCGTPVVVTDNTSCPELCKSGALIPTDADDYVYTGLNTWRKQPKPSRVEAALIGMHSVRDKLDPASISELVSEYHWDNVWKNHWQPIIDKIEGILPIESKEDEMMDKKGE